jgi:hypothetical protein
MRFVYRLATISFRSGERLGEFTTSNHRVTLLDALLTL